MGLSFENDRNIQVTELNETSITDGLVAYYTMDNLNLIDNSGNNNNGINNGATLATGISGNALSFNGSSNYVDYGNNASINFGTGSFSLSAWVNTTVTGATRAVVGKTNGANASDSIGYALILGNGGTQWHFAVWGGTNNIYLSGINSVSINTWYHITGTFNGTTKIATIYIDGDFKNDTSSLNIGSTNVSNNLFVGYSTGLAKFSGLIDEVRIYNRALSAAEVKQLYKLHAPNNVASMKEE